MIKSKICEMLGIRHPLVQGGMAWIADARLAAAVSEAGGLGLISSINFGTEAVRDEIRKCRELTDKPFGVNIMLQAASVAYALKMQECGADAVVAEGAESGGHVGDNHTMALVPQIVDALDIPVLAAGGIFDGRGAAAAFMLGACGVQVGTRFLMADECHIHDNYKEKLIKASDVSTMVTGKSMGDAVRCLKTPFTTTFAKKENEGAPIEELEQMGAGALRKAAKDGNYEEGSFMCGQIAGLVSKRQTAREIVDDLVGGAEKLLSEASSWVA